MDTAKDTRKRKTSSRMEESTEAVTKKLKEAQRQRVLQSSETFVQSQISTPTTQPGTPTANENNDNDDNYTMEILSDDEAPDDHNLADDPTDDSPNSNNNVGASKGSVDSQEALGEKTVLPVNIH